jgi:Mitochondrial carrier protein
LCKAWIEASTKGAVLLFTASELEYYSLRGGFSPFVAGIFGGMGGGIAQAYATVPFNTPPYSQISLVLTHAKMGFCTTMKTAEITRHKVAASGVKPPSTTRLFFDIYNKEGIRGINKGVNAVAIRQMTNWGSRISLSRLAETMLRRVTNKQPSDKLTPLDKIACSAIGGGLSCWNQPIEVIRVEMQSMKKDPKKPAKLSVWGTAKYIYGEAGFKGLYRGVTPRIALGVWQTICMVALGDVAKVPPPPPSLLSQDRVDGNRNTLPR